MSARYLAIFDETGSARTDDAELQSRTGLVHRIILGRLVIYASDPSLSILSSDGCIVLGTIFERFGPPGRPDHIGDDLLTEAGEWSPALRSRYWGNYVALADFGRYLTVLRAPLGALPCYHVRSRGFTILASDALLLRECRLWNPQVDWLAVAHSLYFRDFPASTSALSGVTEILGGQAVRFMGNDIEARLLWSPWDHANAVAPLSEADLADKVRRTIENCVSAHAAGHARILATVSGGLDSSVVASSLREDRMVVGMTMATNDLGGDERVFARALCAHRGIDLIEQHYDLADVDLGTSVSRFNPRPTGRIHEAAFRAAVGRSVSAHGCTAVFSGNGGDNVFYNSSSARPLVDRLLLQGPSRGLFRTTRDISRMTGSPVLSVVGEALRVSVRERKRYRWRCEPELLSSGVIAELEGQAKPSSWLDLAHKVTPAKLGHVAMIMRMLRHMEGYERDRPFTVLNPLGSQPLVELMLSIPAWRFCEGGINRSIVRQAFRSKLPATIIERRTKLGPDAFILDLISARSREIGERLMDGTLAAHGVLDRSSVLAMLTPQIRSRPLTYMRIMAILDAEAWATEWARR